jgi:hypothetical protein
VVYDGGSGEEGPEGVAFEFVDAEAVRQAIYSMSGKKAPGPDGLRASVLRLMWEWDWQRITALVRASIHLGAHPKTWKVAEGITIPKPGKDDYTKAKSYRVISLLNCLGKVVEKVECRPLSRGSVLAFLGIVELPSSMIKQRVMAHVWKVPAQT